MNRIVVGIMGPSEDASADDCERAAHLAELIAGEGWALLTGGRPVGVMDAASKAARRAGGLTIGILPGNDWSQMSDGIDIAVVTGIGEARNNVNVLSSRLVFVCGMSAGTAAEVALASKASRPVILVGPERRSVEFFQTLDSAIQTAETPSDAIALAKPILR
jgi:uncharacterized protein (TIGR00725 family)